ncbi:MAG: monovalent cation/H(+) antiporter subunit G [Candidatus Binatia bacterium]
MADLAIATLFVVGATFILLAAAGLLRMPDVLLRMSCSTKAATLGIVSTVLGAGLYFGDADVALRAAVGALFLLVTMPVAAQMIGRAAYLLGAPLLPGTVDQLRGRYDRARATLR